MTGRPAFTVDSYVDDLILLIKRGLTVAAAADDLDMSRATAYRLLRENKAREAAAR